MREALPPLLTSREQYASEVFSLPQLTNEQEISLEIAAKQGDREAREQLVLSCLSYVAAIAWRYTIYLTTDDYLDLVGIGNMTIVRCLDKAMSKDRPAIYLRIVAKWEIVHFCYYHSKLLRRIRRKEAIPRIYYLEQLDS